MWLAGSRVFKPPPAACPGMNQQQAAPEGQELGLKLPGTPTRDAGIPGNTVRAPPHTQAGPPWDTQRRKPIYMLCKSHYEARGLTRGLHRLHGIGH